MLRPEHSASTNFATRAENSKLKIKSIIISCKNEIRKKKLTVVVTTIFIFHNNCIFKRNPWSSPPDNDGINDLFYIKGKGIGIIKSLVIVNRWGEKVFERTNFNIDDKAFAWDGKYKGLLAPIGTHVYFAEMQCDTGQPVIKNGTLTLVY
ncbi:MAG: gliding motility-associated C-terminal domain-containing protein [Ginsengibacter sp.]